MPSGASIIFGSRASNRGASVIYGPRAGAGSKASSIIYPNRRGGPAPGTFAGAAGSSKAAPKKKSGGGGVFGAIGHVLGQGASDLKNVAVNTPVGLYNTAKVLGGDVQAVQRGKVPTGTAKMFYGQGKQVAKDIRHPLRHPGYTALDALMLASMGAGAGARVAGTARAVRAGDGAGAAVRAATFPKPTTIVTKSRGITVETPASRSALTRTAQRGKAAVYSKAAPESRIGKLAERRVGKVNTRAIARATDQQHAEIARFQAMSRKLKPEHFKALEVAAEGVPTVDRIRLHENRLATIGGTLKQSSKLKQNVRIRLGDEVARQNRELDLLKKARPFLDEKGSVPKISPAFKGLQQIDREMVKTGMKSDERLKLIGALSPESHFGGLNRTGRTVYREDIIPGSGGRQKLATPPTRVSPQGLVENASFRDLDQAEADIRRISGKVSTAERVRATPRKQAAPEPTAAPVVGKPRSEAEAQAFVENFDKNWNQLVEARIAHAPSKISTAKLNVRRAKLAKKFQAGQYGMGKMQAEAAARKKIPTDSDEARRAAEEGILKVVQNSDHPTFVKLRHDMEEAGRLQAHLTDLKEARAFGDAVPRADFGHTAASEARMPAPRPPQIRARPAQDARIARLRTDLGAATNYRRDVVKDLPRPEPAFSGGRVYVPHTARKGLYRSSMAREGFGGTMGVPMTPSRLRNFSKGVRLEQANKRDDVTNLVAEVAHESARLGSRHTLRESLRPAAVRALPAGTRVDEHGVPKDWVLMRTDRKAIPQEIKDALERPETINPDEAVSRLQQAHDFLFPKNLRTLSEADHAALEAGDIQWVPRRLLGGLDKSHATLEAFVGKRIANLIDNVNNAARTAQLYLKVAYAAPNIGGNTFVNLVQQGAFAPLNLAKTVPLFRGLRGETRAHVNELMGAGTARAIMIDRGFAHVAIEKLAAGWSKIVDEPFRQAAFLHEARRSGYRTVASIEKLLRDSVDDAAATKKVSQIQERATVAAIDYSQLGPRQREIVRRVVYFFPWVRGSTRYAGHLVAEHPLQAGFYQQTGRQGAQEYGFAPGTIPSYLEGSIKAGHNRFINPASTSVLGTPAQVGQVIVGALHHDPRSVAQLSQMLTPAVNVAGAAAFGLNKYGESQPGTTWQQALQQQLIETLPQYALVHRLKHGGSKTFPMSPRDAIMQYLIGGLAKRSYDPIRTQRSAYLEQHPSQGR